MSCCIVHGSDFLVDSPSAIRYSMNKAAVASLRRDYDK